MFRAIGAFRNALLEWIRKAPGLKTRATMLTQAIEIDVARLFRGGDSCVFVQQIPTVRRIA